MHDEQHFTVREESEKELKRILLQAKLCTGKTNISQAEVELLKTLVKDNKEQARRLRNVYEKIFYPRYA